MHTVTILIYPKQSDPGFIPVPNCRQRHTMKHGNKSRNLKIWHKCCHKHPKIINFSLQRKDR